MEPQFDRNQLFVKEYQVPPIHNLENSKNEKSEKTIQETENNEETDLIVLPTI